ncbi:hypothetical protein OIV83_006080 [Microbotryomycetes sp. JL201]|nr:hypothetical protein OIV83_006080 [Microbotryomycetes sp. JL201]
MPPTKSPAVKKRPTRPSNDDTPLSLPQLLKVLTSSTSKHALTMSQAMAAAAKLVPKGYTSMAKLTRLTMQDLATTVGIEDAEVRKRIVALSSASSASVSSGEQSPYKRRRRDADLDSPLPSPATKRQHDRARAEVAQDLDFDEIQAEQVHTHASSVLSRLFTHENARLFVLLLLLPITQTLELKSVITNRAPVMTAWATIVAERLGFSRQEALSIGKQLLFSHSSFPRSMLRPLTTVKLFADTAQVYTDMNASSKGVSIGIFDRSKLEAGGGPSQPFVELMGRKASSLQAVPVMSTRTGEWRAMSHGQTIDPQQAFSYIQRNFRQQMGAVMGKSAGLGAFRILATSYSPNELNEMGYSLYCDFRPTVEQWGEKAEMKLVDVLNLQKWKMRGSRDPKDLAQPQDEQQHQQQQQQNTDDFRTVGTYSSSDGLRVVKVEDEQGQSLVLSGHQSSELQDVKPDSTSLAGPSFPEEKQRPTSTVESCALDEFDTLLDDGNDEAFATLDV